MHDRFCLPALIISSVLVSCVASTEDFDLTAAAEDTQEQSVKTIDPTVRIEVSDELSDVLLASPESNPLVGRNGIKSVAPTFYIGGKYEKVQREAGLHKWFDVEMSPLTKSSEFVCDIDGVELVEPVYRIQSNAVSFNDNLLPRQWHYNNQGTGVFRNGVDMKLQKAWDRYGKYGNNSVIVGVLDRGIDVNHEDLSGNMWVNVAELNGKPGVDDDRNGYIDDINGFNFVSGTARMHPEEHGTHVAGTVSAVNNNGKGVAGVAGGNYPQQGALIMAIQVMDGESQSVDPVKEFQYAAENGAVILQNSWSYPDAKSLPAVTKKAIDYFITHAGVDENGNQVGMMRGGLVVFAAGNEERDYSWPAQYEKVLSVSAIGPNGTAAYYTNYGAWVDVAAPGGDQNAYGVSGGVLSTLPNNKYGYMQGTSMACPHVSGLAALILSEFGGPGFTNDKLWDVIVSSADPSIYDYNPDMKGLLGSGMIDAERAMASFSSLPPEKPVIISASAKANRITIKTSIPKDPDDGLAASFNVFLISSNGTVTKRVACSEEFTVSDLAFETDYTVQLSALDMGGNESQKSDPVKVRTGKNNPPVLTVDTPSNKTIIQWDEINWIVTVSEPDGHPFEYGLSTDDPSAVELIKVNAIKFRVNVRGMASKLGKHVITAYATDEYGARGTLKLEYEVKENHRPVVIKPIENICFPAGESVTIPVYKYFHDEDEESLNVRVTVPGVVEYRISGGTDISFTSETYGLYDATVAVVDGAGEVAESYFKILVRDASLACDVYPTEVVDNLYIRTGTDNTPVEAKIIGSAGRVITNVAGTSAPFNPFVIDLKSLAPGRYGVEVKVGSQTVKATISKK